MLIVMEVWNWTSFASIINIMVALAPLILFTYIAHQWLLIIFLLLDIAFDHISFHYSSGCGNNTGKFFFFSFEEMKRYHII